MALYLRIFLTTAVIFGILMALTRGHTDSAGDFAGTAAAYGIPFGIVMAAVLGTLQRRGERREMAKRTDREETGNGQQG